MAPTPTRPIRVWDLPLRLTKWSFVGLVAAMWYTAENSLWYWHTRLGVVLLALLMFRIIWGLVGTRTALFSQFVRSPRAALDHLRGRDTGFTIGHNPLGAFAVLALIAVMLVQVTMGLFAGDPYDGATGPLNSFVGVMTADTITDWHEDFLWVVLCMAGLHIIAVSIYSFIKLDDLIGPMVTGKREEPASVDGIEAVPWARAVIAFAASAGFAFWIWLGAPPLG